MSLISLIFYWKSLIYQELILIFDSIYIRMFRIIIIYYLVLQYLIMNVKIFKIIFSHSTINSYSFSIALFIYLINLSFANSLIVLLWNFNLFCKINLLLIHCASYIIKFSLLLTS